MYEIGDLPPYLPVVQGWIIPAIMAVAGIVNSLIQSRASKKNAQRTAQANIDLSKQEFAQNKEMWDVQNQYNAPDAQMMRLQGAGLNPNLVYGSGAVGNQSGPAPQYRAPSVDLTYKPMQIPEILGQYQNFQMRQAQIDNVKAQTENTHARTMTEAIRKYVMDIQGKTGEFDLSRREYLRPYEAAITGNEARASEAKLMQEWEKLKLMGQTEQMNILQQEYKRKAITAVDIDNEKRQAELLFQRYRNEWMKAGVTSSDNVMLRILIRMMNESGFSAESFKPFK